MNEHICLNCFYYKKGRCHINLYRPTKVDPSHTCDEVDVIMAASIRNHLHLLPAWQAWAIPRFSICILAAFGIALVATAIYSVVLAVGALIKANVPGAIILIFVAVILCFFVWCCISLIQFIVEEVLENE